MSRSPTRVAIVLGLSTIVLTGCNGAPVLPDSLNVVLPDDQHAGAAANTGPELLAGQTWALRRPADATDDDLRSDANPAPGPYGSLLNGGQLARPMPGQVFARVDFGPDGVLERARDNCCLLPELYGSTIEVSSQSQATSIPGGTFASSSYGVSIGDRFGVAIFAEVRFFGSKVGTAVVYAWGTRDGDTLIGTFGYKLDFGNSFASRFLKTGGDQYAIEGTRE